jgi:hypothetical protein
MGPAWHANIANLSHSKFSTTVQICFPFLLSSTTICDHDPGPPPGVFWLYRDYIDTEEPFYATIMSISGRQVEDQVFRLCLTVGWLSSSLKHDFGLWMGL